MARRLAEACYDAPSEIVASPTRVMMQSRSGTSGGVNFCNQYEFVLITPYFFVINWLFFCSQYVKYRNQYEEKGNQYEKKGNQYEKRG